MRWPLFYSLNKIIFLVNFDLFRLNSFFSNLPLHANGSISNSGLKFGSMAKSNAIFSWPIEKKMIRFQCWSDLNCISKVSPFRIAAKNGESPVLSLRLTLTPFFSNKLTVFSTPKKRLNAVSKNLLRISVFASKWRTIETVLGPLTKFRCQE